MEVLLLQHTSIRISALFVLAALLVALTATAVVAATVRGTNGDDILTGTPNADKIYAKSGADTARGFNGNDIVHGGPGDDLVKGGQNKDSVFGNTGNDTVVGGSGPDRVGGGTGRDTLEGRGGDDHIAAAGDGQRDRVSCGTGTDVAVVDPNDLVDDQLVSSVLDLPGQAVGIIGSCERVEVRIFQ